MLENGTKPDMISFGIGAGDILASLAHTITSSSVRSDLQAGGIQDGSIKAVPWCFGGYLLCSTKIEDLSYNNLSSLQDSSELKVIGTGYNFNQPNSMEVYLEKANIRGTCPAYAVRLRRFFKQ